MIQYYEDPQGIKIKTINLRWDKVNPDFLVHVLKLNLLNQNHYLKEAATQSVAIYNKQANIKLKQDQKLLFNISKVHATSDSSCYVEINFYLPENGYSGIRFDEEWVILWIEKVAYNLAKNNSFDSWIKGFESRYPSELLDKMKMTWSNFN